MSEEDSIRQQELKQKRHYWKTHIASWQASRVSQADYCRRHKLKFHQFVYWRRKFTRFTGSSAHEGGNTCKQMPGERIQLHLHLHPKAQTVDGLSHRSLCPDLNQMPPMAVARWLRNPAARRSQRRSRSLRISGGVIRKVLISSINCPWQIPKKTTATCAALHGCVPLEPYRRVGGDKLPLTNGGLTALTFLSIF